MERDKSGIWGEIYAARYLRDNGCDLLTANYSVRMGEIDLIACEGGFICFVEVKTRSTNTLHRPLEAVDESKKHRIILTASTYMAASKCTLQPRFDVAEVWLEDDYSLSRINYIKNAFESDV